MPVIGAGKDREHGLAAFDRHIRTWGREQARSEFARATSGSRNSTPPSRAWWVGWLSAIPNQSEVQS
jgi:hypothetical protein